MMITSYDILELNMRFAIISIVTVTLELAGR